ncbi:MAG TPA: hypothetical protein VK534_01975 [Methylomirabilota bacterium]|nr:hypothetical protein [Methylomirabilota bacterium]
MIETEVLTLSFAEGSVDPAVRVANGEIEQSKIDELAQRLRNGEFRIQVDPESIPGDCMDCRRQSNGAAVVGVKAAGGTTTLVVADALTTNSYRQKGEKAPQHKRNMLEQLSKDHEVGGHTGAEGSVPCGAETKLDGQEPDEPSILGFMERKSVDIFGTLRSLGYEVEPELEDDIVAKTTVLRQEDYATTGEELAAVGIEVVGRDKIRELSGVQNGVMVALLTKRGEILDQEAICDEYGDEYGVFEIEAWSIANGANKTALGPEEAHQKEIAGLAYNLGSGGVIVGPGMRVEVL